MHILEERWLMLGPQALSYQAAHLRCLRPGSWQARYRAEQLGPEAGLVVSLQVEQEYMRQQQVMADFL